MLPIVEALTRMALLQDLKLELIHIVPPFDPFPNRDPTARARCLPEALEFWEKLDGLSRLANLRNVLIVFNKRLKDIPEYEEERLKKNIPSLVARNDVRVLIDWYGIPKDCLYKTSILICLSGILPRFFDNSCSM